MLTVDPLLPSDIPAALRLSTQTDWNQVDGDWRRMVTLWPGGCLAGRVDGQLLATTVIASHIAQFAWVGVVLVDKAHRGQGFGGQMLDAALDAAQEMGIRTLGLDATEFGRPIYLTRGFSDVGALGRWVRQPRTATTPGLPRTERTNSRIMAPDPGTWKEILSMDNRSIRLDRSRLLNLLRTEPGVNCRALGAADAPRAFAFIRPGRTASHIGPVIAESESAAEELLDTMLAENADGDNRPIQLDIPAGRLENWLKTREFVLMRSVVRMRAGIRGPDLLGPRVFAAFGFDLG